MQGFRFGKPESAAAIEERLAAQQARAAKPKAPIARAG
jgi:hypothetical protein